MKNIEKYKDEILKYAGYQHLLMCLIYENIMKKNDCTGFCSKCKRETIEWLTSEYKEPILNDEEKEIISILTEEERKYLSTVFEPFKEHIKYVQKEIEIYSGYDTTDGEEDEPVTNMAIYIHFLNNTFSGLPFFDEKMFANMENYKDYTLEELGL